MGDEGIEPSTSVLSGQRSTTELVARVPTRDLPPIIRLRFSGEDYNGVDPALSDFNATII